MRVLRFGLFAFSLSMTAIMGLSLVDGSKQTVAPVEIAAFYEDYNFISSFSTARERSTLLDDWENAPVPEDSKKPRLEKVLSKMKKLKDKIWVADPGMLIGASKCTRYFGFHFRPVLFRIENTHVDGDVVTVEVHSYELGPEMILRFISDYDRNMGDEEKFPSFKERLQGAQAKPLGVEVHRWCCRSGKWMKSAADLFFLEERH
ncbi:MAG: hypothetical protein JXB23_13050 [Candidatus Aminicenantes bacterium]|nr:hypothetical protein [Candidatus Aminicenantes bacterium]